jgi:hypothetical protein
MTHPSYKRVASFLLALLAVGPVGALAKDGDRDPAEQRSSEVDDHEVRDAAEATNKSESHGGSSGSRNDRQDRDRSDGSRGDSGKGGRNDKDDRNDRGDSGGSGDRRNANARLQVERDARDGDRLRDEVVMIGRSQDVESVRQAGFSVLAEQRLESLQQTMVRVRVRSGENVDRLMDSLHRIAPEARIAPNHVFRPSGAASAPLLPEPAVAVHADTSMISIGLIDTGADRSSGALGTRVSGTRGFTAGGYIARPHGTLVAQIASQRGAPLLIADVFGIDQHDSLAASADLIAAAVDWLQTQHVRVINISIEGPHNLILEYVIGQAVSDGVVVVAAAGNGGPASKPVYPAAYAGVVAVTAVDQRGQVYRRAARGPHIQFAARGVFERNDNPLGNAQYVAGTSYAAPVVAAEFAWLWQNEPADSRDQIDALMRREAVDMGAPGRDPVYGWGVITPENVVHQ